MYVIYQRKRQKHDALAVYTEAKPGPKLEQAIEHALRENATLAIVKIGRLVMNVEFTGRLSRAAEAGLNFICFDNPACNERTIHILAGVAQERSMRKSQATKEVMASLKAQGVPLGSARPGHWKGRTRGWRKAVPAASKARSEKARREYQWLLPEIKARRERGDTMVEIVQWLNDSGKTTSKGMPFTQPALWRIIKRYLGDEYLGNATRQSKFSRRPTAEQRRKILTKVVPRIKELREQGMGYGDIAEVLNNEGFETPTGGQYAQSTVWNLANKFVGALQA